MLVSHPASSQIARGLHPDRCRESFGRKKFGDAQASRYFASHAGLQLWVWIPCQRGPGTLFFAVCSQMSQHRSMPVRSAEDARCGRPCLQDSLRRLLASLCLEAAATSIMAFSCIVPDWKRPVVVAGDVPRAPSSWHCTSSLVCTSSRQRRGLGTDQRQIAEAAHHEIQWPLVTRATSTVNNDDTRAI